MQLTILQAFKNNNNTALLFQELYIKKNKFSSQLHLNHKMFPNPHTFTAPCTMCVRISMWESVRAFLRGESA